MHRIKNWWHKLNGTWTIFRRGFESNRIVKLQKLCAKALTSGKYNTHPKSPIKQLNIPGVPDILLLIWGVVREC